MAAFIKIVMIIIEVLSGFLLVGVILLQRTKSQGLGGMAFGASIGESVFGSRAGNVLTKATIVLGCVFLANTLFLAVSYTRSAPTAAQSSKSVMDRRGVMPTQQQAPRGVMPTTPTATTPVPVAPAATPAPAATAPATTAPATPAPAPAAAPAAK
ncbi:MAG: preprotein translocase subunit SecG [Kiritimatiellaeota bacterium]|nr:preprotein translocase subunit SecG [Kiritimatiellota bacterium]